MECDFFSGEACVGVLPNLPVDVLLGNDVAGPTQGAFAVTRSQTRRAAKGLSGQQEGVLPSSDSVTSDAPVATPTRPEATEMEADHIVPASELESDHVDLSVLFSPQESYSDSVSDGQVTTSDLESSAPDNGLAVTPEPETREPDAASLSVVDEPSTEHTRMTLQDVTDNPDLLKELQQQDPTLNGVRQKLVSPDEALDNRVGFYLRDGLLHRTWRKRCAGEGEAVEQLIVPRCLRQKILDLAHDHAMGGHLGVQKTKERVLRRYYWPGVFQDVALHCKTCGPCQKTAGRRPREKVELVNMPQMSRPFQRGAVDMVGPLQRSRKGNRYILVLVDYATRFPEATPLSSTESEKVADALIDMFSRYGIPDELLSDQGTNFVSTVMQQVCDRLGIKKIKTSPYHPQTNGLVERFNGTLKSMLRRCCLNDRSNWDKYIPLVLFAYREVPQQSLGFSPFELLYGYPVRGPLDVLRSQMAQSPEANLEMDAAEYVTNMSNRMRDTAEIVQENLAEAQSKQKTWYDKHSRAREFETGQQVLVLLPSSTSKFKAAWQGPYRVEERLGSTTYRVRLPGRRSKVYHVNLLRPWYQRGRPTFYAAIIDEYKETMIPSLPRGTVQTQTWEDVYISDRLDERQKSELRVLLHAYKPVFSDLPGRTKEVVHDVKTTTDVPITRKAY